MKHTLTLTIAALLLITPLFSHAQLRVETRAEIRSEANTERAEIRAEHRAEFETRVQERTNASLERREEVRDRLAVQARNRIENIFDRIFVKFNTLINRFERASIALEERIADFEARGNDMTTSSELLTKATLELETLIVVTAEAEAQLQTEIASEEVSRETIRAIIEEVREQARMTHQAYIDVIVSIRAQADSQTNASVE